jgi:hypothetical protein
MLLLNEWEVIAIGFCTAFLVVNNLPRIKLFKRKPFNCMPCMTLWMCYCVAIGNGYDWLTSLLFIPVGYFIGSLFEAIKMRWL